MGIFRSNEIYNHMSTQHGGIYTADPIPDANLNNVPVDPFQGADYREQARLLRELEVRRQQEHRPQPQQQGSFCVVM